jgi:hypothetical protein
MKRAPERLAFFFLAVTIYRLAFFMADGMILGWLGVALAIGTAAGVYVCAYYAFRQHTWPWALPGLAIFGLIDMAFNMLEVVRTLSTANFVPKDANFLNMSAADIRWMMQWAGIAIGIFPTVATALLGLIQSGANKMTWPQNQSFFGQIQVAILAKFGIERPAIAANEPVIISNSTEIQPTTNGKRQMTAKGSLTAEQRAALPTLTDGQIVSMYGIKPRTARKWRQDIKNNTW